MKETILVLTTDGVFNNKDSIESGINFLPEKIKLIDEIVLSTDTKVAILNTGKSTIAKNEKYVVYNEIFRNLGLTRGIDWYFSRDGDLANFLADKMRTHKVVVVSSNNKYARLGRKNFHLTNYNIGMTGADSNQVKLLLT